MAKITNRFVHFKTKASFTSRLAAGDIQESSVVFIQEANEIWTHGTYYSSGTWWDMNLLTTDPVYALRAKNNVKIGDYIYIPNIGPGAYFSATIIDITIKDPSFRISFISTMSYSISINPNLCVPLYYYITWNETTNLFDLGQEPIVTSSVLDEIITSTYITSKYLESLPTPSNSIIVASDTILQAFSKLQGQVNTKITSTDSITGNAASASKWLTPRTFTVTGGVSGNVSLDGSGNITLPTTLANLDASKITSGVIGIERLPKGALERLVKVANQSARFALTVNDIQDGDTVQQIDTGIMYFVVDTTKLNSEAGYNIYTAGSATSVPWSGVTGRPTFSNVATSGSYSDLSNKPTIPTLLSQLSNDTSYISTDAADRKFAIGGNGNNSPQDCNSIIASGLYYYETNGPSGIPSNNGAVLNFRYSSSKYGSQIAQNYRDGKLAVRGQNSTTWTPWKNIALSEEIPTSTSQLTNNSGFITSTALTGYATQTWVGQQGYIKTIPAQTWASITGKPSFATVATSGSYNDLANKPSIPSLTGYATESWVTSKGYLTSLPIASASVSGIVTTGNQEFAGVKTFNGGINIGSGYNFGATGGAYTGTAAGLRTNLVFTGASVGSYNGASNLTIDIPEIPLALPNPFNLTINGRIYNGADPLVVHTELRQAQLSDTVVTAGFSYNNTQARAITIFNGFAMDNPDCVIISSAKLTFTSPSIIIMNGLNNLSGPYYIYCLSYTSIGKIAINGSAYGGA